MISNSIGIGLIFKFVTVPTLPARPPAPAEYADNPYPIVLILWDRWGDFPTGIRSGPVLLRVSRSGFPVPAAAQSGGVLPLQMGPRTSTRPTNLASASVSAITWMIWCRDLRETEIYNGVFVGHSCNPEGWSIRYFRTSCSPHSLP